MYLSNYYSLGTSQSPYYILMSQWRICLQLLVQSIISVLHLIDSLGGLLLISAVSKQLLLLTLGDLSFLKHFIFKYEKVQNEKFWKKIYFFLHIIFLESWQMHLTAVFFETGAKTTPTKSRNPTNCGWGGLFQSYLTHL